jgi:hypothetical protein
VVVQAYNPSNSGGRGRRITSWRPARETSARHYLKNKIPTKRAKGRAQEEEHLPSMLHANYSYVKTSHSELASARPRPTKKKKKKKRPFPL